MRNNLVVVQLLKQVSQTDINVTFEAIIASQMKDKETNWNKETNAPKDRVYKFSVIIIGKWK